MRALVTGGNGFVGRHLCDELRARGYTVTVAGRAADGAASSVDVELDLASPASVAHAFERAGADVVFHLAAQAFVPRATEFPIETYEANVLGTARVIDALRARPKAERPRLVFVSSGEVYGARAQTELPLRESAPAAPPTPYAASKAATEAIVLASARTYEFSAVVTRAFNHIGPGQSGLFVVPAFAARIARIAAGGDPVLPVGNLESRRDFLDVRDVARAYADLAERGADGEIYNVCSGVPTPIVDILRKLVTIAHVGVEIREDPALMRAVDVPVIYGDNAKLRAATGWEPSFTLIRTLRDVYDDVVKTAAVRRVSAERAVYFEMIGGASGNMLLGAMMDAGADPARIERALRTIPVDGWSSESRRVDKRGIAATYFDFIVPGEDHHRHEHAGAHGQSRHLAEVIDIVERSGLTLEQRARARAIYVRLAEAEATVHGTTADRIHFHEVGAVDAILDVAGTCVALDLLDVESVWCSAFPVGHGTIDMDHGRYPNPPPTTVELLRGSPTYDAGTAGEMVTPTGAAILTELVARPGVRPEMVAESVGYGAGRSDFTLPNVLRASIGTLTSAVTPRTNDADAPFADRDEVVVLEANVDDMSPQRFEIALERTLAAGAFDVWLAPVTMKKSRPAILFGAIGPVACEAAIARAMLVETTTLGVRVRRERRYTLPRETVAMATPFGEVRVKTARIDGQPRRTLEYDDVARIARERGRPFAEIAAHIEASLPGEEASE